MPFKGGVGVKVGFFKSLFGRDWRRFKKKGDGFLDGGEWGRARGAFQEALRLFDGEEGEKAELEVQLKVANERLLEMHTTEADRYIEQGMSEKASEHLTTALDFVAGHEEREALLKKLGQVQRDNEVEEEEVLAGPETSEQNDELGVDDPHDEEETFYVHLSTLSPDQADVYSTLGEGFRKAYLAMMAGNWDKAEVELTPVYESDPENVYLQYEMGRLRLGQERYEEAEVLLAPACEKAPDMIPVRHARIETLWGLKEYDKAERVVEEAFEIDDELLGNFLIGGETCLRSGEYENGVEIVEAGVELHGQAIGLHRLLGKLQAARENTTSAIEAFETALRLRWRYDYDTGKLSFDLESAFLAANLYLTSRTNLGRSEELFRSLLATGEESGRMAYLVGAGQALMLQGEESEAKTFLVEAARLAPEGSEALQRIEEIMSGGLTQ